MVVHYLDEPVVGLTGTVDAVGGCESERHLARVGCFRRGTHSGWLGVECRPCEQSYGDDREVRKVRWLDGTDARPLIADDHHAFHEDAKPGDLSLQLPIRAFNSSAQFSNQMSSVAPASSMILSITNR